MLLNVIQLPVSKTIFRLAAIQQSNQLKVTNFKIQNNLYNRNKLVCTKFLSSHFI